MPCFYLTPKHLRVIHSIEPIVADPGAYTKEELPTLHSQIVSNLERAWEIANRYDDSNFTGSDPVFDGASP